MKDLDPVYGPAPKKPWPKKSRPSDQTLHLQAESKEWQLKADLENMTPAELQSLADDVQKALEQRRKEQARHVLAEARHLAVSVGYEAAFTKAGKTTRPASRQSRPAAPARKVAPKYRNPENPEEVWSGRGRQPSWVQKALASGMSLEKLAIA